MSSLSEPCVRALRAATAAACIEARNLGPTADLWKHVLDIVHPVVQEHARQHTAVSSPAAKLPDELLVEVFAHLPLWDRMTAENVCHHWRDVSSNAAGTLWSTIPSMGSVEFCRALLARSRQLPITFEYDDMDVDTVDAFADILAANMHRIKHLRLDMSGYDDPEREPWDETHLLEALQNDAPILESVEIFDPMELYNASHGRLPVLEAPRLRRIDLRGLGISYLTAAAHCATLQSLRIATPREVADLSAEDWSTLTSFPALQTFGLQIVPADPPEPRSHHRPLPVRLRRLQVESHWQLVRDIAECNDLSQLQSVHIWNLDGTRTYDLYPHLLPFTLDTAVSAAVSVYGGLSMKLVDDLGRERVFHNLHFDHSWPRLLAKATKLFLSHEQKHDLPTQPFEIPSLVELILNVTPGRKVESLRHQPTLVCPRLTVVRFVSTTRAVLPVDEVCEYLGRSLTAHAGAAASRPRLVKLVFDGITFAALEDGIPSALGAFAESIEILNSAEADLYEKYGDAWDVPWESLGHHD